MPCSEKSHFLCSVRKNSLKIQLLYYINVDCRPSTDATALFLVDVDQTAIFQPVNGRRSSTSILQPFSSGGGQKRSGYVQSYVVRWYVPTC